MIFWTSKVTTEAAVVIARTGLRSWRWVLEGDWTSLELRQEVKSDDGVWHDSRSYYRVDLNKHFKVGRQHVWWDGPNCSVLLGFLQVSWSGWNDRCTKCSER